MTLRVKINEENLRKLLAGEIVRLGEGHGGNQVELLLDDIGLDRIIVATGHAVGVAYGKEQDDGNETKG